MTIAIRYSCVRRQGGNNPGEPEKQVIDYKAQQAALFPLLATAYALLFTGNYMYSIYSKFRSRTDDTDFSDLPELHATSAGLKAVTTDVGNAQTTTTTTTTTKKKKKKKKKTTADGIETCRRYCGGHGYHRFSALPDLLMDYLPHVTGEGVNPVLCLQTARYLVRQYQLFQEGKQVPNKLAYFYTQSPPPIASKESLLDPSIQVKIFEYQVWKKVQVASEVVSLAVKNGR